MDWGVRQAWRVSEMHDALMTGVVAVATGSRGRRGVWVSVAFVVLLAVVAWATRAHLRSDGGDPGGARRAVASQARSALPQGAAVVQDGDGTSLRSSCDGRPGTEGWSDIVVSYRFTTAAPSASVLAHAASAMATQHWAAMGHLDSPLGPGLTWAKPVTAGVSARATLTLGSPGPGQPTYWDLAAVVPPAGKAVSGC